MENEEWKTIPGFSSYKASTHGRIMSFRKNKNGALMKIDRATQNGYQHVTLVNDENKSLNRGLHVFIAMTFIENPDSSIYNIVNHKNGVKTYNHAINLEWCTQTENVRHTFDVLARKGRGYKRKQKIFNFEEHKNEDWRGVPGYTDYKCNDMGDIISFKTGKCILLRQKPNSQGYIRIGLYDNNGEFKMHNMHQIIAEVFLENPKNSPYVNHKNGIRHDNRAINLEWCTQAENIQHAYRELSIPSRSCENGGMAKLTNEQVREIIKLLDDGVRDTEIAKNYGVSRITISNIKLGKQWIGIPRPRKFEKNLHANSNFTDEEAIAIYTLSWLKKMSQYKIAEKYNTTQTTVNEIMHGKYWFSVTGHTRSTDTPNWELINKTASENKL
jgi:hypothetical protein